MKKLILAILAICVIASPISSMNISSFIPFSKTQVRNVAIGSVIFSAVIFAIYKTLIKSKKKETKDAETSTDGDYEKEISESYDQKIRKLNDNHSTTFNEYKQQHDKELEKLKKESYEEKQRYITEQSQVTNQKLQANEEIYNNKLNKLCEDQQREREIENQRYNLERESERKKLKDEENTRLDLIETLREKISILESAKEDHDELIKRYEEKERKQREEAERIAKETENMIEEAKKKKQEKQEREEQKSKSTGSSVNVQKEKIPNNRYNHKDAKQVSQRNYLPHLLNKRAQSSDSKK